MKPSRNNPRVPEPSQGRRPRPLAEEADGLFGCEPYACTESRDHGDGAPKAAKTPGDGEVTGNDEVTGNGKVTGNGEMTGNGEVTGNRSAELADQPARPGDRDPGSRAAPPQLPVGGDHDPAPGEPAGQVGD